VDEREGLGRVALAKPATGRPGHHPAFEFPGVAAVLHDEPEARIVDREMLSIAYCT
jgi:hypothetical protein